MGREQGRGDRTKFGGKLNNIETRYFKGSEIRLAQPVEGSTGSNRVEGYAAKFNSESLLLFEQRRGEFYEVIKPGAFTDTLATGDIRALVNHDENKVIGRTKSKTLQLREDANGLWFSCELPNTSYATDLKESLARGDIDGCSFGFRVEAEDVEYRDDGTPLRSILAVELREVSLGVTFPAYPETSIALRSIEHWKNEQAEETRRLRTENAKLWLDLYR